MKIPKKLDDNLEDLGNIDKKIGFVLKFLNL